MIRFTGDTHGEQGRFFELGTMGEETWTEKDTLIVCGDFGYVFKNDSIENVFLNELEKKNIRSVFAVETMKILMHCFNTSRKSGMVGRFIESEKIYII